MGETPKLVSPARVFARPTADQIWLGPPQRAALSQLSRAAQIRLIVGPASCGKTTLAQHIAGQSDAGAVVLHCRGPKTDAAGVLTSLLLSADLAPWDLSAIEQRNLLTVFIQQRRSQGRRVVLLVDDAQSFDATAIEEFERLLAFKVDKRPAVELLVIGPASLAPSWQRVGRALGSSDASLICEMPPASTGDLVHYLDWRLGRFDLQAVLTPIAANMIAKLSGGRYAAADVLCQMSLLLLRRLGIERVDARVVRQAVAALAARHGAKLETDRRDEHRPSGNLPQGHVVISRSGKVLTRAPLGQRTLIGRSEHNDVCLSSPYLSRHHAAIVGTPEGYYLVDLNSANGVHLNGRRIERTVLCDEDVLTIGPFRLKVQIPDWLAQGSPLPEAASLADTAVMQQQTEDNNSALWRVK